MREMEQKQLPLNGKLMSIIVYCHIVLRNVEGVEQTLDEMREMGCKPSLDLVELAVMRCEREGNKEATARLMQLVGSHSWRVFASRNKVNFIHVLSPPL
jgi:pentatricopeptide repeat protein